MGDLSLKKIVFGLPDSIADIDTSFDLLIKLKEKIFSPKDIKDATGRTKVSPRVFLHWKDFGLLPFPIEADKWVKLNFIEYVWVCIIQDLRKIGCSLSLIKKIKEILFKDILTEAIDIIKEKPDLIESKINEMGLDKDLRKEITLEKITEIVNSMTLFENMLTSFMLMKKNVSFFITIDEEVVVLYGEFYESIEEMENHKEYFSKPYISIPLSSYIFKFIDDKTKESFLSPFAVLNEEELTVLKAIRNKEFKEVIIKPIKGKEKMGTKKYDIITVKDGELSEEQQKQITEILGLQNYQSITLKKKNNSSIYFEREHRR